MLRHLYKSPNEKSRVFHRVVECLFKYCLTLHRVIYIYAPLSMNLQSSTAMSPPSTEPKAMFAILRIFK